MKNKDIDFINKWLATTYGTDILGRAYYRIVWTDDQIEKRKGLFEEYYGRIFIRSYYGIKEIKKYLYHKDWESRWVLEKMDYTPNEELYLEVGGHYEPLYVFYDQFGDYQKPTLRVVQFFMKKLLAYRPWKTSTEYRRELDEMEQKELDEEIDFFYGCLEDKFGGDLASAIRQKEGVVNPGAIFEPNGTPHYFNRGQNGSNSSINDAVSL